MLPASAFLSERRFCMSQSGERKRPPVVCPFPSQEQLLDPVRMEEVVQRHVAEHDEHGVVAVFSVFSRPPPDIWWKLPKPDHELPTAFSVFLHYTVQAHAKDTLTRALD